MSETQGRSGRDVRKSAFLLAVFTFVLMYGCRAISDAATLLKLNTKRAPSLPSKHLLIALRGFDAA
jgi:hypothetical protein